MGESHPVQDCFCFNRFDLVQEKDTFMRLKMRMLMLPLRDAFL